MVVVAASMKWLKLSTGIIIKTGESNRQWNRIWKFLDITQRNSSSYNMEAQWELVSLGSSVFAFFLLLLYWLTMTKETSPVHIVVGDAEWKLIHPVMVQSRRGSFLLSIHNNADINKSPLLIISRSHYVKNIYTRNLKHKEFRATSIVKIGSYKNHFFMRVLLKIA